MPFSYQVSLQSEQVQVGAGTKNRKISGNGAHKMAVWCHFPTLFAEGKGHLVIKIETIDGCKFADLAQPFWGVVWAISSQPHRLHLLFKLGVLGSGRMMTYWSHLCRVHRLITPPTMVREAHHSDWVQWALSMLSSPYSYFSFHQWTRSLFNQNKTCWPQN